MNVSELKRMAAQDFKNLLQISSNTCCGPISSKTRTQCAIPAFDGLFPEPHNKVVMDLLFTMAHWHGLVKLCLHHNLILDKLDQLTKTLGERLHNFNQNTCVHFDTKELWQEYNMRIRREVKQTEHASRHPGTSTVSTTSFITIPQLEDLSGPTEPVLSKELLAGNNTNLNTPTSSSTTAPRARNQGQWHKPLNINTYKFHSYGDYTRAI